MTSPDRAAPPASSARDDGGASLHDRWAATAAPLVDWLVGAALPRWAATGVDRRRGGFFERIDADGQPVEAPRRARVVARQIYVFATAARRGWLPGADAIVEHGLDFLLGRMKKPDGSFASAVTPEGRVVDTAFDLYEQAFVLFALATAHGGDAGHEPLRAEAEALLARLRGGWAHPRLGFESASPRALPLRSNPHMHLLEAALAWIEVSGGEAAAPWTALANELVELCLTRFIDAGGALRECFDGDWRPMPGPEGGLVEPGHQFEWAWLLTAPPGAARLERPDHRATAAARLLEIGETHGVDPVRGIAVNALDAGLSVTDPAAKLWPQTERVKAWHGRALGGSAEAEAALRAAVAGLQRFLQPAPAGLWREQMEADGGFVVPECRASSLYHIVCAIDTLAGPRPPAVTRGGRRP